MEILMEILPIEIENGIISVQKINREVCTRWRDTFDKFTSLQYDKPELLPSNLLNDKHFEIINNGDWSGDWQLSSNFMLTNVDKLDWKNSWRLWDQSKEFLFAWSKLKDDIVKLPHQFLHFYNDIKKFKFGVSTTCEEETLVYFDLKISGTNSEIRCLSTGLYHLEIKFRRECNGKLSGIYEYAFTNFGSHRTICTGGTADERPINIAIVYLEKIKPKNIYI